MSIPADMRAFNRLVISEFRANEGEVTQAGGGIFKNSRLMLLTTIGASSGRPHTTPLGYVADGPGRILLWASNNAAPSHPTWYRNLCANPNVTVEVRTDHGVERFEATARTAEGIERELLFEILTASGSHYAEHQRKTDRLIPIVVCERLPR